MNAQVPSEKYLPGQLVNWHRESGPATKATVVRMSKSGNRVKIKYDWHPSWSAGRLVTECTYVKPTSLSARNE
jgi:hypothetical protein